MRLTFAAIVIIGWPVVASGQTSTLAPLPPLPPIGLPLPQITSPLTPIALPLAPIGFPVQIDTHARRGDQQRRGPHRPRSGFDVRRGVHSLPSVVYFLQSYDWGVPESARMARPGVVASDPAATATREERATGTLRIDLQPAGAAVQLYVDGMFVGTPDDLDGELTLAAGAHNIEARAPGHANLGFAVQIAAGRSITYRGTLQRVDVAPSADPAPVTPAMPAAVAPPAPSTFYFIPGCYMGNVPPAAVVLPADCDRTRLVIRSSQR
jgi:hypothetical protein